MRQADDFELSSAVSADFVFDSPITVSRNNDDARQNSAGLVHNPPGQRGKRVLCEECNRKGDCKERGERGETRTARDRMTTDAGIQHGSDSPFQMGWARHDGHRGNRAMTGSPKLSGEREQVFRVLVTAHPEVHNGIVTGPFALEAQARRGKPHDRVEPVGDAHQLAADLDDPIVPPYVRELVCEDDADPIVLP